MHHLKQSDIEKLPAQIESLSHDGRGIAIINGKTTFISGCITSETVHYKIIKKHRRYDEAIATEVLHAASERTTPVCAHFNICGGCSMQHIAMTAQVELKQKILLEQLKHFGNVMPHAILPPITGNAIAYRRKARLGVRYVRKKERLFIGFREKSSNLLTHIDHCPVLHPTVGERLSLLYTLVNHLEQRDHIPQIEVAVGDHATALVFRHMMPLSEHDLMQLSAFGQEHAFHIYLQPNPPAAVHKLWPINDNQDNLSYALPDYALGMFFHPLDFTQVNHEINQKMISSALQLLEPTASDHVLDLFCGLGNFTLPIARYAHHVTGIEGSQEMVKRAYANAAHNKINNVEFHAANLMESIQNQPWAQKKYDKILLDPPRTGAKEILAFFPALSAQRIVYVSCNPATLARDAGELVHQHGYQLMQVGVVNMFPHTSHIETIALFEKR